MCEEFFVYMEIEIFDRLREVDRKKHEWCGPHLSVIFFVFTQFVQKIGHLHQVYLKCLKYNNFIFFVSLYLFQL